MSIKDTSCIACGGSTRSRPGEPKGSCPACCRPESEVLASCLELLAALRIPHWRNNTGGLKIEGRYVAFGVKGAPDVLGILPPSGRLLCCETKSRTGKVTKDQAAWLERAEEAGALCVVCRSIDDLRAALASVGIVV